MKKILILSASTGQGHNQAANSLKYAFEQKGFKTSKHDFLEGSSKPLLAFIVGSYEVSAMKFPLAYGFFYKITNNKFINPISSLIPFYFVKKRMYNLIIKEKPDLVVTTHPLSVCLVSGLKRMGIKIPFVSITTDFKPHYTYISKDIDLYISGSNFSKNTLIKKGISEHKIYPLGIPIKKDFFDKNTDIDFIKTSDYFNILLMSGSMGLEDISLVLEELLKNSHSLRITVVCGNNKFLKQSLDKHLEKTYKNKKLHILGFSNDIAMLMDYSDILISKPGGLTVTESIAKNLPLIIPFSIPGQEEENTEFLISNNLALTVKKIPEINPLINELIEHPSKLSNLKTNINALKNTYSINKVIDLCNDLINKKSF